MAIFNSKVLVYQRVHGIFPAVCGSFRGGPHEDGRRARPGMPRSFYLGVRRASKNAGLYMNMLFYSNDMSMGWLRENLQETMVLYHQI